MASAGDIRDIMDLGQAGPRAPAPKKKKKRLEPQQRLAGVTREVQALMGDSVPPIAIVEQKAYKSKPSITQKLFKPRHWEERQFVHGGRTDGLVLRHWKRSIPGAVRPQAMSTPIDVEVGNGDKEAMEAHDDARFEEEFPAEKWNVKVKIPTYSDEQYESHFRSEDWTRQETDYLMTLCGDFDLRWILIGDRYDPADIPGQAQYPPRTTEAMKQRYYTIAAKMMELGTPQSSMTNTEFQLWDKMRTFDAKTETSRKAMAEKLFERSKEEAEEEKLLLEELHRITKSEEEFIALRKDLYSRLESAPALRRTERGEEAPTAAYQTSQGLSMLLQNLLAKERKIKRPANAPEQPQPTPTEQRRSGQPNQYSRRETMDSTTAESPAPTKKGSVSQAPQIRTLTPAEETKFGVTHPTERITSGVHFRHDKINRLMMAKSQVQTSKIQAALHELGFGSRLTMPTERVTREFERLIMNVNLLLDARKTAEKVANEIKVLEEARRIRLGQPKEGEAAGGAAQAGGENTDAGAGGPPGEATGAEKADHDTEEEEDAAGEEDVDESKVETMADESTMQVDGDAEDDDEDANGEEDDDDDDDAVAKATVADEDDEDNDQSYADLGKDDEEEDEEDDDDEGLNTLGKDDDDSDNADEADAVDDSEDEEAADNDNESDASDDAENSDNEGDEDASAVPTAQPTPSAAEDDADEDADEAEAEEQANGKASDVAEVNETPDASRPASSHSQAPTQKSHKRSASVVSDASRAGSNRSAVGRKKRR
jgi:DNA methyltransferase 1-associated protein 1